MIVIGVDVHKHSLAAVAVDEAGRLLDELTVGCPDATLLAWAARLGVERLWAVEDCRQVTRALERRLLAADEELVLKLLVVHRDDLVGERRRAQQRLRWHLHQRNSPATGVSHRCKQAPAAHNGIDSIGAATANSTVRCTALRSRRRASIPPPATTSHARKPKARATAKRSAASNDNSHAPSPNTLKAQP
jgi:hypothetical protein